MIVLITQMMLFLCLFIRGSTFSGSSCSSACGKGFTDCYCDPYCTCYSDCCNDFYVYCHEDESCVTNFTHILNISTSTVGDPGSIGPFFVTVIGQIGTSDSLVLDEHMYSGSGTSLMKITVVSSIGNILAVNLKAKTEDGWNIDGVWLDGVPCILPSKLITLENDNGVCTPKQQNSWTNDLSSWSCATNYTLYLTNKNPTVLSNSSEHGGTSSGSDSMDNSWISNDIFSGSSCSEFCGPGVRMGWVESEYFLEDCNLGKCAYYDIVGSDVTHRCKKKDGAVSWNDLGEYDTEDLCQQSCTASSVCNFFVWNIDNTRCTSFELCQELALAKHHFKIQGKMLEDKVLLSELNEDLKCLTINTPRSDLYQFPIWVNRESYVSFSAATDANLYISLSNTSEPNGQYWEVVIGEYSSFLLDVSDGSIIAEYEGEIATSVIHSFWISWPNNSVIVGFGNVVGVNSFMNGTTATNYNINLVGISTDTDGNGTWVFGCGRNAKVFILWLVRICCLSEVNIASTSSSIETVLNLSDESVSVVDYQLSSTSATWDVKYEIQTDNYTSPDLIPSLNDSAVVVSIVEQIVYDFALPIRLFETVSTIVTKIPTQEETHENEIVCIKNNVTTASLKKLKSHARRRTAPCFTDSQCSDSSSCVDFMCQN